MGKICESCGEVRSYRHSLPIDDHLAETWGLSTRLRSGFNVREGDICTHCGAIKRAQSLAAGIIKSSVGFGARSLKVWVQVANDRNLQVCELNACHELHNILLGLENLTYAEYGTDSQQDIEDLTYKDKSFDLVLHSETLEHVGNPGKAMDECRRVLKKDGLVLFTTPVIWSRKTRCRAKRVNGSIKYLETPSYHAQPSDDYLVFYEYGRDIDQFLGCSLAYSVPRHQSYVFMSGKTPSSISKIKKLLLSLFEITLLRRI